MTESPNTVYRYFDHADRTLYIGITSQSIGRHAQHKTSEWWPLHVGNVPIEHCTNRTEALRIERELIQVYKPPFNKVHNENWEPIKAAYLALVAAEEALEKAKAGEAADGPCKGYECTPGQCAVMPFWDMDGYCDRRDCAMCHSRAHESQDGFIEGAEWQSTQLADSLYWNSLVGEAGVTAATEILLSTAKAMARVIERERGPFDSSFLEHFTKTSALGRQAAESTAEREEAEAEAAS